MANSLKSAIFLLASRMEDAARGDGDACYDLGLAYSSGTQGVELDLIQAHMWFNLAALNGNPDASACRTEIAWDMSAREIAEAQRQARAWLGASMRHAA